MLYFIGMIDCIVILIASVVRCVVSVSIGEGRRMRISEIQRFHTDLKSGAVLRTARSAEAPKRNSQTLASVVHRRELGRRRPGMASAAATTPRWEGSASRFLLRAPLSRRMAICAI